MSELKVILATPHPKMKNACDGAIEVYLKSEADKVIADLEESHKKEVEQLLIEIVKLNEGAQNLILDNYLKDKEARHSNYKRCLDNAWGCQQRMQLFHELVLEEARTIALPNEEALKEYRSKRERAAKWRKRWLKIAEKFKDLNKTSASYEAINYCPMCARDLRGDNEIVLARTCGG